jgi:hypothetical protein
MLRTAAWMAGWLVAFYVWTWVWSDQSDHLSLSARVEVMLWGLAFLIALGLRYEIEMIKVKLDLR